VEEQALSGGLGVPRSLRGASTELLQQLAKWFNDFASSQPVSTSAFQLSLAEVLTG
jgi:hypothetical protein